MTNHEICEKCVASDGIGYFDRDYEEDPSAFNGCNTISELPEQYLMKRCPCIKWREDKLETLNVQETNCNRYPQIESPHEIPQHCLYIIEHLMLVNGS